MSLARIVVFAFALIHVVGLADLVMEDGCEEACDDDGCGTDCLPGVACRCHCPSSVPLLGSIAAAQPAFDPHQVLTPPAAAQRMHASPDPREILHVPKHAL